MTSTEASILVVDDNQTTLHLLASFLTPQGYRVTAANTGEQALACLREDTFDLMMLDMLMPKMSGLELCREIKGHPDWFVLPVIFITGHQDDDLLAEAFAAGGVDYLTKPFILPELLARVQTHLRLSQTERQLKKQLALRDLMLTSLGHDLRGPGGTAARMLSKIRSPGLEAAQGEQMLELTESTLYRTYELLDDMLSWSQAVSGTLPFRPDWYHLRPLVAACCEPYYLQAEHKKIEWVITVPEGSARLDKNLVRSILLNLIGNAVKFTPSGGQIHVLVTGRLDQLDFSVSDTGMGLSAPLLAQLQRRHRVNSLPGTAGEKGSGMGLQIAQEFAHCHGGHVDIHSVLGSGSRFTLVLPQAELTLIPMIE